MTGPMLCPSPASNTKQLTRMYGFGFGFGFWGGFGVVFCLFVWFFVEQFLCTYIFSAAFMIADCELSLFLCNRFSFEGR